MVGAGATERTGLGIGYGVFDAMYVPDDGKLPEVRYGRNYVDKSRWTGGVPQYWGERLALVRDQWAALGVTVRLFKVCWQGQGLGRGALVGVLQEVLQPVGEVLSNLAVESEMQGCAGE